MPAYQQLMLARPAEFEAVGRALTEAKTKLTRTQERFDTDVAKANAKWQGEAKDAHAMRAELLSGQLTGVSALTETAGGVATTGGEGLGGMCTALKEFVESIEAAEFLVTPTGVVTISPEQEAEADATVYAAPAVLAALEATAVALTGAIEALVGAATGVDEALAGAVAGVSAGLAELTGVLAPAPPDLMGGTFPADLQPGQYSLGDLMHFADGSSRGTSLDAYIHPDQLQTADRPDIPDDIEPAGYLGADGPHAKSHLLADTLGGPVDDPRNYVTLYSKDFSRANDRPMAQLERRVRDVVAGNVRGIPQQNVRYRVEAVGTEQLPSAVRIIAQGDRGYTESVLIPNL